MSVTAKLSEAGIVLPPPLKPEAFAGSPALRSAGQKTVRLIGVAPWVKQSPELNGVLSASDTVSWSEGDAEIAKSERVKEHEKLVQSAFFRSVWLAGNISKGGLDSLNRCLSVHVYIVTSPNFAQLGYFARVIDVLCSKLFGPDHRPQASVIGVVSLPMANRVVLDAEYLIKDKK